MPELDKRMSRKDRVYQRACVCVCDDMLWRLMSVLFRTHTHTQVGTGVMEVNCSCTDEGVGSPLLVRCVCMRDRGMGGCLDSRCINVCVGMRDRRTHTHTEKIVC